MKRFIQGQKSHAPHGRLLFRDYGYVADDIPEMSMAVSAARRGQGAGTRLLQGLITQAERDGYRGISLSVDPRNSATPL